MKHLAVLALAVLALAAAALAAAALAALAMSPAVPFTAAGIVHDGDAVELRRWCKRCAVCGVRWALGVGRVLHGEDGVSRGRRTVCTPRTDGSASRSRRTRSPTRCGTRAASGTTRGAT